jgi:hypothetical protein
MRIKMMRLSPTDESLVEGSSSEPGFTDGMPIAGQYE